ncbi:hypothetical protein ACIXOC_11520 [Bacteroides fragilis]|jgi:hypothetical protein
MSTSEAAPLNGNEETFDTLFERLITGILFEPTSIVDLLELHPNNIPVNNNNMHFILVY